MKLFYTPNSPYARICRITAMAAGLMDRIELDWVPLRTPDSPVIPHATLGRIPLLVDGDLALSEARHICAYLHQKAGTGPTVAAYGDWPAVAAEGHSLAFLDAITVWSRETRRSEEDRSAFMLAAEAERAERYLAHLDSTLVVPAAAPPLNFNTLCLVAALGMMRFYDLIPGWRAAYPTVAAWSDAYDAVPAIADTAPSQDALIPLTR
ncbi:MAG: glutathione S-transferase [Alphaproteobacteria bacterium]|nr:glutathione S-transferase [Alphaproteobacteria bacterium]